jgi:hypothetical protein
METSLLTAAKLAGMQDKMKAAYCSLWRIYLTFLLKPVDRGTPRALYEPHPAE